VWLITKKEGKVSEENVKGEVIRGKKTELGRAYLAGAPLYNNPWEGGPSGLGSNVEEALLKDEPKEHCLPRGETQKVVKLSMGGSYQYGHKETVQTDT